MVVDSRLAIELLCIDDFTQEWVRRQSNATQTSYVQRATVVIEMMHTVSDSKVGFIQTVLERSVVHLIVEETKAVVNTLV